MHSLTHNMHIPELFRARGCCRYSVYTFTLPPCACTFLFVWLISLALEVHPLVSTLIPCQDLLRTIPRMGMTSPFPSPPLSSCWAFFFQTGLWWKGKLLIIRRKQQQQTYTLLAPHPTTQRNPARQPVLEKGKDLLPTPPPANRNWKIWAILGLPFFPHLCQYPSCRFPLFLYCNILER